MRTPNYTMILRITHEYLFYFSCGCMRELDPHHAAHVQCKCLSANASCQAADMLSQDMPMAY